MDNISHVQEINVLGISLDTKLRITNHFKVLQPIDALKILHSQGLATENIHHMFSSLVIGRILYACPSWWGFASNEDKTQLRSFIKHSLKFGFCSGLNSNFSTPTTLPEGDEKQIPRLTSTSATKTRAQILSPTKAT